MHKNMIYAMVALALVVVSTAAMADNDEFDCNTVRFGIVSWPAVTIKTKAAKWMLEKLGYNSAITTAATPVIYQGLADGNLDAFMAQWMPSQREVFRKFGMEGSIDVVSPNLRGGKYTIAVPSYVYDAGVTSIKDLAAHKDKFEGKIYGIDPGSGGNSTAKRMLDDDYAGLGDWKLVASSVAGMLIAVGRHIDHHEWIAFLGWAPHPMNVMYDIRYLSGGADYWGPNKGEVIVDTVARKGYIWACPNIGQFLDNYDFTVKEQSTIMDYHANKDMDYLDAEKKLIRDNPELLDRWFNRSGIYQTGRIKTADGEHNARDVIAKALGID